MYDLSYLYLRPMLHLLELADYSFQSLASYLLALAQVLGIAVCRCIDYMGAGYDFRTTYIGGHPTYNYDYQLDMYPFETIYKETYCLKIGHIYYKPN